MSIIEGIGDEVLYTFIMILISIVFILAWLSTYVSAGNNNYLVFVDHYMYNVGRRLHYIVGRNQVSSSNTRADDNLLNDIHASPSSHSPSVPTPSPQSENVLLSTTNIIPSYTTSSSSSSNMPSVDTTTSPSSSSNVPSSFTASPLSSSSSVSDTVPTLHQIAEEVLTANSHPVVNNTLTSTKHCNNQPSTQSNEENDSSNNENDQATTSHETNNAASESEVPADHILIKLQYIDGKQRIVHAHPDETIGEFKRRNFSTEMNSGCAVRFIMSGQELKNESMSLKSYKVCHNNVIHCLVSTTQQPPPSSPSTNNRPVRRGALNDIGSLAFPLFGMGLGALWYARIFYRGYFNGASTISLLAITFLYGLSLMASFRTSPNQAHLHRD